MPTNIPKIEIKEYDYLLPNERIAQYPLGVRDASKLLVYRHGDIVESTFRYLTDYVPAHSVMVFNDTKVIHARIFFEYKQHILEVFCLEPIAPELLPEKALGVKNKCTWACMIGNARKWKEGTVSKQVTIDSSTYTLKASRGHIDDNAYHITFEWDGDITFGDIISAAGTMPLPPYIKRVSGDTDEGRYQTVYATHEGSVAAPTAGLHFTKDVLQRMEEKRISKLHVTLHVGAGTFKPVKADDIYGHTMHEEIITIDTAALKALADNIENCIAVGTTSLRTIESAYWCGVRILKGDTNPLYVPQWYAYNTSTNITYKESIQAVLEYLHKEGMSHLIARTALLCMPGYTFHGIKALVTNFHQPRSTLLLLVSAFVGSNWKSIYEYARHHDFRFLSYGDASLLFRHNENGN